MRDEPFYRTLMNYAGVANGVAGLTSQGRSNTSGSLVQMVSVSVKGFTTTTGTKAVDAAPFTSGHGSGFGLSVDLKPTSVNSRIYVAGSFYGSNSSNGSDAWGLFLAASTSAIIAGAVTSLALGSEIGFFGFQWQATTVSAATTTYAVRLAGAAGTFTLNGQAGAGLLADSIQSSLTVWEVLN